MGRCCNFGKNLLYLVLIAVVVGFVFRDSLNKKYHHWISKSCDFSCPKPRQLGGQGYFSQYFEDYILSIVFNDINSGTYIDVGSNDGISGSATRYFYLKGWKGINIEANGDLYNSLLVSKPNDINLNIGAGNKEGTLTFYQFENTGLSTFNAAEAEHRKKIHPEMKGKELSITVTTLNSILSKYSITDIDILKIDVEGFEKEVLEGLDFKKYRPKVILLEAIVYATLEPNHEQFESILLANDYLFVMFDGLNRYYLAKEHNDLLTRFHHAFICTAKHAYNSELLNTSLIWKLQR